MVIITFYSLQYDIENLNASSDITLYCMKVLYITVL